MRLLIRWMYSVYIFESGGELGSSHDCMYTTQSTLPINRKGGCTIDPVLVGLPYCRVGGRSVNSVRLKTFFTPNPKLIYSQSRLTNNLKYINI